MYLFRLALTKTLSGRCLGETVAACNVCCASIADKFPGLACGPQREIFGKRRRAVLNFHVARSKARSSESMLVPS